MPPPKGTPNPLEGPGDYDVTSVVHSDTYPAIDPKNFNLRGKVVLVTGASRGYGRAMCAAFARAGTSRIVVASRSDMSATAEVIKAAAKETGHPEPEVLTIKADVGVPESVDALAHKIDEAFGYVDVVINNAAFMKMVSIPESDPADWLQTLTANVYGPYLIARALAPLLVKSQLKTIINISSVGAHLVSPNLSSYQISKLALIRLTEFISVEYADKGIVSYSVHPGNSPSEMLGGIEGVPEELRAAFVDTPALCANSLVYLASERRLWLAGRYINLTWDLPELMTKEEEIFKGDKLKVRLVT
ncbi:Short chain dehydrogenase citE [Fusarium oxysporum f. sp. rapae]|uniref:Short chain dehydrogenase citE n=1 Tax=Fusarium oxysporum f. sp. rapae TaxID=485398 RepID=A0A8J5TYX5_FUSOX|nr:Short chain dehydrogenase citE [Fusarium oxysporum f. sp. rapae]